MADIIKKKPEPADYIEEGSMKHTHVHPDTGAYISAVTRPKGARSASITDLYVPDEHRNKGIGKLLLKSMMDQFPSIQGQVSSKIAAKNAYDFGRRMAGNENASLNDIYKKIDEDSSVNMWTQKAGGGSVSEEDQGITAYHASPAQISAFKPSQFRGATYFAPTPKSALSGAYAGMNEMIMETATEPYSGAMHVHEVSIDPEQIKGLHYTPKEKEWFKSLPKKILGDDALEQIFKSSPNSDIPWDDLYDHHKVGDRLYEYTKRKSTPSITYEQAQKTGRDVYGKRHSHYGHGADEKWAAKNALENGMKGYLMHDEGGLSIAMADPSEAKIKGIKKFADGGTVDDGITAYHGSPHEFEQFDLSKIGTGEGAQAYGHGLYFAESEPVAKEYRDKLSQGNPEVAYKGKALPVYSGAPMDVMGLNPEEYYASMFGDKDDPEFARNAHIEYLEGQKRSIPSRDNLPPSLKQRALEDIDRQIAEIKSFDPSKVKKLKKGHMYEVQIDAHPDSFLDWDKPIGEQGEVIRRLAGYTPEYEAELKAAKKADTDSLMSELNGTGTYTPVQMPKPPKGALSLNRTGEDLYEHLKNKMGALDWPIDADHDERMKYQSNAAKRVSDHLSENGIHGIRYLDANSRLQGKGSRNYVVFDDKRIKVKRRYERGGMVEPEKFEQAFANARSSKQDKFHWTNPETGEKALYTTQLARKDGGKIPSISDHDQWRINEDENQDQKPRSGTKMRPKSDDMSIVSRAVMLSSRKS